MNHPDEDQDDPVVAFRRPNRYTAPDRRATHALNADDLRIIRKYNTILEDDEEFQHALISISVALQLLIDNIEEESQRKSCSCSSRDEGVATAFYGAMELMDDAVNSEWNKAMSVFDTIMEESDPLGVTRKMMNGLMNDINTNIQDIMNTPDNLASIPAWNDINNLMDMDMHHEKAGASNVPDEVSSFEDYESLLMNITFTLGCSLTSADDICDRIIDMTAIRQSEYDVDLTTDTPKKNRTIAEFSNAECKLYFRFTRDQLTTLFELFFRDAPKDHYIMNTCKFTYEETLLIALDYMANGTKYSKMKDTYGGDHTRYTYPINFFARFIHHKYYHRICGKSMSYWASSITAFREAIWRHVCFKPGGQQDIHDFSAETFPVFGWIDCMQHSTCAPGSGPINDADDRRENAFYLQRAFYSAYGKKWGMKTQALHMPNGMIGNVWHCSVSHNDKGAINLSGLEPELIRAFRDERLTDGTYPVMFADEIYMPSQVLVKRSRREGDLWERLTSSRIYVEHIFGTTSSLWKRLSTKHCWKLLLLKERAFSHYMSTFFMTNIHTCCNGNGTSSSYNFEKPSLEDYLNVTEEDAFQGPNEDAYMISVLNH